MSDLAIAVKNVSKIYKIGLKESLPDTFSSVLWSLISRPVKNFRDLRSLDTTRVDTGDLGKGFIWALRDLSLEVRQGERLGIVGSNGAGKTTLLKILSRITEPTSGEVWLRGRVGSLLEVGVGFHPELTGRENVFLNGAILGMRRHEIDLRFDEIVSFAEIGQFIDTPVKRYSSGMYVRLAFAVAAHLETDILVVDEVLAVGDAAFQRRCLGKMSEVAAEGRTVLFVSHQLGLVRTLCERAVLIENGQVVFQDTAEKVVDHYLRSSIDDTDAGERRFAEDETKAFQITRVRVLDRHGSVTTSFTCEDPVVIELSCNLRRRLPGLYGYLTISRPDGTVVVESDSHDVPPNEIDNLSVGSHVILIEIPPRTLAPGRHVVYLNFTSPTGEDGFQVDSPQNVVAFDMTDPFTQRGNRRKALAGTLLRWEPSPRDSVR